MIEDIKDAFGVSNSEFNKSQNINNDNLNTIKESFFNDFNI